MLLEDNGKAGCEDWARERREWAGDNGKVGYGSG